MTRCLLVATAFGCMILASTREAAAQATLGSIRAQNSIGAYSAQNVRRSVYSSAVPRNSFSNMKRNVFTGALSGAGSSAASRPAKPFSSVSRGSGPSPWLSLSDPFASTAHSYYTQVRPQLAAQGAQGGRMSNHSQVGASMSQSPAVDPQGNEQMAPTGHTSTFMNWGGYYSPVRPTKAPARQ